MNTQTPQLLSIREAVPVSAAIPCPACRAAAYRSEGIRRNGREAAHCPEWS